MVEIMNCYCTLYPVLPIFLSGGCSPYAERAQRHRAGESAVSALWTHTTRMIRHVRDGPRRNGVLLLAVVWRTRPPCGGGRCAARALMPALPHRGTASGQGRSAPEA